MADTPRIRDVASLRREFDDSFAVPPAMARADVERFVAVRVGGAPFALPVADISGLHADYDILLLPSPIPAMLGVAIFRGDAVAVYDLAGLIGHQADAATRWLVHTREGVAYAFEAFEAHLVVARADLVAAPPGAGPYIRGTVQSDGVSRPIISLAVVLGDIRQRVSSLRTIEEG